MSAIDQLLIDIEAKRDIAYMEAQEKKTKADTLDYVAIMLRNAILTDKKETDHASRR